MTANQKQIAVLIGGIILITGACYVAYRFAKRQLANQDDGTWNDLMGKLGLEAKKISRVSSGAFEDAKTKREEKRPK